MKKPAGYNIFGYLGAILVIAGMICPVISYGIDKSVIIYGYNTQAIYYVVIALIIYAIGEYLNNKATVFIMNVVSGYFIFELLLNSYRDLFLKDIVVNVEVGLVLLTIGMITMIISTIGVISKKENEQLVKEVKKKVEKDDGFPRLLGNIVMGFNHDLPPKTPCFMIFRNNQLELHSKSKKEDFTRIFAKKDLVAIEGRKGISFENDEGKNELRLKSQKDFLEELIKRSPLLIGANYVKKFEEDNYANREYLQIYETGFIFINNEKKQIKVIVESFEDNTAFVEIVSSTLNKKPKKDVRKQ